MKSYRDLKFWDRAHRLVLRTFELTRSFPKEELVSLTQTMRRTAMTITSSLVEGFALGNERETIGLVQNAIGASGQFEYQVVLAHDLGYLPDDQYQQLTDEIIEIRRQLASHLIRIQSMH